MPSVRVIITLVTLAALAALAYSASLYFKKSASESQKSSNPEVSRWPQETIEKDPEGYITWALGDVCKIETRLHTCLVALEAKEFAARVDRELCVTKTARLGQELEDLTDLYDAALASNDWPAKLLTRHQYHRYDKHELEREIDTRRTMLKGLSNAVSSDIERFSVLKDKAAKIEEELTHVARFEQHLRKLLGSVKEKKPVESVYTVNAQLDAIASIGDELNRIVASSSKLICAAEGGTAGGIDRPRIAPIGAQN
jgi:hypothetical protein